MRLDPVTLEILGNKVLAACEEMNATLQRSSRSLFVKEAADYACALIDLEGRMIAGPRDAGVSLFVDLDAMPTIRQFDDLGPGDIILTNDPYLSGSLSTHLLPRQTDRNDQRGNIIACLQICRSQSVNHGWFRSICPGHKECYLRALRADFTGYQDRIVMKALQCIGF